MVTLYQFQYQVLLSFLEWLVLTQDGQTCRSQNLQSVEDASECQRAINFVNGDEELERPVAEMPSAIAYLYASGCHTHIFHEISCGTCESPDVRIQYAAAQFNPNEIENGVNSASTQFIFCRGMALVGNSLIS